MDFPNILRHKVEISEMVRIERPVTYSAFHRTGERAPEIKASVWGDGRYSPIAAANAIYMV